MKEKKDERVRGWMGLLFENKDERIEKLVWWVRCVSSCDWMRELRYDALSSSGWRRVRDGSCQTQLVVESCVIEID